MTLGVKVSRRGRGNWNTRKVSLETHEAPTTALVSSPRSARKPDKTTNYNTVRSAALPGKWTSTTLAIWDKDQNVCSITDTEMMYLVD